MAALAPDVLCLQETKCPDEHFPHAGVQALGFAHQLVRGMKGYNGVAILSRCPSCCAPTDPDWCGKGDCRHLGVTLDAPGGPIELHDFYVPAGGDIPGPREESEIRPQARLRRRGDGLVRRARAGDGAR